MKPRLSKSKVQQIEMCSWKYKLQNIDRIPEPRTNFWIYAQEGTDFHLGVEHFFSRLNPLKKPISMDEVKLVMNTKDLYAENFIEYFVKPILLKSCKNEPKYYFPVLSEEKIFNEEYNFAGIVDDVHLNPINDEYVVIDWKTGKVKPSKEVKEELAYYKFLIDESSKLPKPVKYGAMFFAKTGKLFYEEFVDTDVKGIKEKIILTQNKIEEGKFTKNNKVCFFCGYSPKWGNFCDAGKM